MSEDQAVSAPAVDVAAIRAALDNATPGPWRWQECSDGWDGKTTEFVGPEPHEVIRGWGYDASGLTVEPADAELIVLLRNNAEALLDEVERLRARPVNLSGWIGQSVEWDTTDYLAGTEDDL